MQVVKFLKIMKFEKKVRGLFESRKGKWKRSNDLSSQLFHFDDVLEITWQLGLFPFKISKKHLRFNFLYCRSYENGLTVDDFSDLLLVTAIKFGPHPTTPELNIMWLARDVVKGMK
jgi:hypothetical protein